MSALAQAPQALPGSRQVRPLVLHQNRYRLRAGERLTITAPQETLDFVRRAKSHTATIGGTEENAFVVGPSVKGDDVLLGASLLTKPGEYAVTMSAMSDAGEERTSAIHVTVDSLAPVPSTASGPPVVLLNGWQFGTSCPMTSDSSGTFGKLRQSLEQKGLPVYFFENCTECPSCLIEELGAHLGQFLNSLHYDNGGPVIQFDLVSHSMGGLIVRSYLAGLQTNGSLAPVLNPKVRKFIEIATPNFGSFLAANYSGLLANGTQASEMVPGSSFLWNLGTWNQRGDDLRGVDALAIVGNAGYWQSSVFGPTQLMNASDGAVTLTSASLNFARDPSRTRILPYCHTDPTFFGGLLDCTGKGIANVDDAPETGQMILSFLAGTSAWQSIGLSNQTQYGGAYFALENAAGTQFTPLSSVSLASTALQSVRTNTVFYNEFLSGGIGTFTATSTANQTTNCGPFTVTGGTFSIFRCKPSPVISSVGPLLPDVAGSIVHSGATITINGTGFGQQQCSTCQVSLYPNVVLTISSWSDRAITAVLPLLSAGALGLSVQTAAGSDSISFMAAPPPAAIQLTTRNSASFAVVPLAPDSIAFSDAPGIAPALVVAAGNPWPPALSGASLEITDSQSQKRLAPLYYVTTNAMSYLIPAGTALGLATAKLTTSTGATITGTFTIDRVSPGLFTANASGSGVPAGLWIRAAADNAQTYDYLFDPAKPAGSRVPVPVDLGAASDQVYLSLYGTGFRGATQATATVGGVNVPVSGFAAVGFYQGEDVVNVGPLPRSLAGRGEVGVALTFDGKTANIVTVSFR